MAWFGPDGHYPPARRVLDDATRDQWEPHPRWVIPGEDAEELESEAHEEFLRPAISSISENPRGKAKTHGAAATEDGCAVRRLSSREEKCSQTVRVGSRLALRLSD